MKKIRIISIVGPTASGKTALSILLAQRLGGEIVSGDSMQIYREMNIGTAKPGKEERQGIPHHLMDIINPDESFSVAQYCALGKEKLEEISSRGKLPIVVGGTGLYIDSLLSGNRFMPTESNPALRQSLHELAQTQGEGKLREMLFKVDPESAERLHENDTVRLVRALEIYELTGKPIGYWNKLSREQEPPYDVLWLALCPSERELLYQRIDQRVDEMLAAGLLEEVTGLLERWQLSKTAANAIGYKELLGYLEGACSLEQASEEIKRASRRYAKRQLTWFRRNGEIFWLTVDGRQDLARAEERALELFSRSENEKGS